MSELLKFIVTIIIVLCIIYFVLFINKRILFPFSNSSNRPNESFQEYFQRLLRTRYNLFIALALSIKKAGLPQHTSYNCNNCYSNVSTSSIIRQLYDNSREIGNSFIPFFAVQYKQQYGSGPLIPTENNSFRTVWDTPFPPYDLDIHGTALNINGNLEIKKDIQQVISDSLQKQVDLTIKLISNNKYDLNEQYALLASNNVEFVNIIKNYNITGLIPIKSDNKLLDLLNQYSLLLLTQLNEIKNIPNIEYNIPNATFADLEFPTLFNFKKGMNNKCRNNNKLFNKIDSKLNKLDDQINNVIVAISKCFDQ